MMLHGMAAVFKHCQESFSLHKAFVVRKVYLGSHSDERNLIMEDYDEKM